MIRVFTLKLITLTLSLSVSADTARAASYKLVDVSSRLNVRVCGQQVCNKACDIKADTPLKLITSQKTSGYQKVYLPESLTRCPSTGWVAKDFLKSTSDGERLFNTFGKSEDEVALVDKDFFKVFGVTGSLNVRTCGSRDCNATCKIGNETPLVYSNEETEKYVRVKIPSVYKNCSDKGWVAKKYVKEAQLDPNAFFNYTKQVNGETSEELSTTFSSKSTNPASDEQNFLNYVYNSASIMFSKERNYDQSCRRNGNKDSSISFSYCYRWVKCQLKNTRITSRYLSGGSAKNAGPELTRIGLKNVINSVPGKCAKNAPNGAVLVYSGGAHGHIETKSKDKYVSDYKSDRSRTGSACTRSGRGRTLTGVYVK